MSQDPFIIEFTSAPNADLCVRIEAAGCLTNTLSLHKALIKKSDIDAECDALHSLVQAVDAKFYPKTVNAGK